jgi:hypothetical protein
MFAWQAHPTTGDSQIRSFQVRQKQTLGEM